jgi:endo-1,4-beta-mannosidase
MGWWKAFDRAEVEREFAEIAALGLDVVRIFLFWEDFQPEADLISDCALDDLGTVLDVALETGLQIMPTFFTGHMSGVNWWPQWALLDREDDSAQIRISNGERTDRVGRDPYADPFMLQAEELLVRSVCARHGDHPAIFSWNLSNEPDIFAMPRSYADGARWNEIHAAEIRRHSSKPVSAGMHLPMLTSRNGFRPDLLAPHNDWLSMHAYSIYYAGVLPDDPLNTDVVPLASLATEALGGTGVLLEEFGYASSERGDWSGYIDVQRGSGPSPQFLADDAAGGRYYAAVLEKLAWCGALGAFAWCFSDYDAALWDSPPLDTHVHERWFGLTRADGSVKPSGHAIRAFRERLDAEGAPPRRIGPLSLDVERWYRAPGESFAELFNTWSGKLV